MTEPIPAPVAGSARRSAGRPGPAGARAAGPPTPGRRARPDERGITTAEYAVGTAAGAGFAGLLYAMLSGGFGRELLRTLFDHVLGLLGLG